MSRDVHILVRAGLSTCMKLLKTVYIYVSKSVYEVGKPKSNSGILLCPPYFVSSQQVNHSTFYKGILSNVSWVVYYMKYIKVQQHICRDLAQEQDGVGENMTTKDGCDSRSHPVPPSLPFRRDISEFEFDIWDPVHETAVVDIRLIHQGE